jgi:hypothetical protein
MSRNEMIAVNKSLHMSINVNQCSLQICLSTSKAQIRWNAGAKSRVFREGGAWRALGLSGHYRQLLMQSFGLHYLNIALGSFRSPVSYTRVPRVSKKNFSCPSATTTDWASGTGSVHVTLLSTTS